MVNQVKYLKSYKIIRYVYFLVKVRRCIPSNEEWILTNEILITTLDSTTDKQIFNEQILR